MDGPLHALDRLLGRVASFRFRGLSIQGIDLAQRKWSGRSAVEIAPQKAVGGHAEVQRRRGGVLDGGRPVLVELREVSRLAAAIAAGW